MSQTQVSVGDSYKRRKRGAPKTPNKQRRETIRNRYAYSSIWGGVKTFHQDSVGGRYGISDFSQTFDSYVKYGDNIPQWKRRISQGESATTKLSVDDYQIDPYDMQAFKQTFVNGVQFYEKELLGGSILPTEVSNDDNIVLPSSSRFNDTNLDTYDQLCLNEFLVRASTESDVQGAVFLGELGKTKQLLKERGLKMVELARNFRSEATTIRRSVNSLEKLRRSTGKKFLEYQHAWKPLVKDVLSIWDELANQVARPPMKRITAYKSDLNRGSNTGRINRTSAQYKAEAADWTKWPLTYDSHPYGVRICGYGPFGTDVYTTRRDYERGYSFCKYVGTVRVNMQQDVGNISARFGLQPTDVASYAWELTPYSWLADYLLPVGDILAIDWDVNAKLSWTARTRGYVAVGIMDMVPSTEYSYQTMTPERRTFRTKILHKRIERDNVSDTYLQGGFVLKVPKVSQFANVLALVSKI